MKSATVAGYALAGWVLGTGLLFGGLFTWLQLLTARGDGRQFYVLVSLLFTPLLGAAIGIPAGVAYGNRRLAHGRPGERPSVLRGQRPVSAPVPEAPPAQPSAEPAVMRVPPTRRDSGASAVDGVALLIVALVPGVWSGILFTSDPPGTLRQAFNGVFEFCFFLGPVGLTLGLVYGGVTVLRQSRRD